jgi:hypothetical protein
MSHRYSCWTVSNLAFCKPGSEGAPHFAWLAHAQFIASMLAGTRYRHDRQQQLYARSSGWALARPCITGSHTQHPAPDATPPVPPVMVVWCVSTGALR